MFTTLEEQRNNPATVSIILQRVQKLSLHPCRLYGVRRQNDEEPVAPSQSTTDLVVPLIRSRDVVRAIPVRDLVLAQKCRQPYYKTPVFSGVREENSGRLAATPSHVVS